MFNFTTTTLIHSADQFIPNPTNTTRGQAYSEYIGKGGSGSYNTLWVNGVNLFRKENIVAIYRNPYMDPLAGRLVVDIKNIFNAASQKYLGIFNSQKSEFKIRLKFSLRRTGDNNSYYARDEVFKGKDFVYEFVVNNSTTVASIAKQIKKINRLYGDIYLDVHVGTAAEDQALQLYDDPENDSFSMYIEPNDYNDQEVPQLNKLVFVSDNYGLFTDAVLEFWADGISNCCEYIDGGWIPFDQIETHSLISVKNCSVTECDCLTRGVKDSEKSLLHIIECVNGTGTYEQILKDLRLPTMENLGYMSLTQQMNEMPVPGMKYVQYTLHYVKCRGILGGSAVGEVTHSKTTHVFFVPADCCNCEGHQNLDSMFRAALDDAFGWNPCEGTTSDGTTTYAPSGRAVPAPHTDPVQAQSFKGQLAAAYQNETRTNNDTAPYASTYVDHELPQNDTSAPSTPAARGVDDVPGAEAGGDTPSLPIYMGKDKEASIDKGTTPSPSPSPSDGVGGKGEQ